MLGPPQDLGGGRLRGHADDASAGHGALSALSLPLYTPASQPTLHLSVSACICAMSEPEPGLDGWHVCGVENQLFYSENQVVKISDTESVNIQNASRHHWTPDMWSTHNEVGFWAKSAAEPPRSAAASV